MGVTSCILGYADNDLNRSLLNGLQGGSMCTLNATEEVDLAKEFIKIHKWSNMVKFCKSGGEACMVAIRIAMAFTNKDNIAFCGYHGWHDWYLATNMSNKKNLDNQLLPGLKTRGVSNSFKNTIKPFIYNDIFRYSSLGDYHPVLKKRVSNVYDLSKLLSIKQKVKYFFNDIIDLDTLALFHTKDYLEVLKETERRQKISEFDKKKYNLGTPSNPIFKEMFRRHAISTGALILAIELLERDYNYAFTPGSGAHHAKANMASGFCYLNDIVVAILVLKNK